MLFFSVILYPSTTLYSLRYSRYSVAADVRCNATLQLLFIVGLIIYSLSRTESVRVFEVSSCLLKCVLPQNRIHTLQHIYTATFTLEHSCLMSLNESPTKCKCKRSYMCVSKLAVLVVGIVSDEDSRVPAELNP